MRRLPIKFDLPQGESLDSLLDRVASAFDATRLATARRLGLVAPSGHFPGLWGTVLAPPTRLNVAEALEIAIEDVEQTLVSGFDQRCLDLSPLEDGRRPDRFHEVQQRWWLFLDGTRICPGCLQDGGFELTVHRLPWKFACTTHGTLLLDRCPSCNRRPRSGPGTNTRPANTGAVPNLLRCSNVPSGAPARERVCDFPLIESPIVQARDDQLDAQRQIDRALASATRRVMGIPVTTLEFFDDLHALIPLFQHASAIGDDQATTDQRRSRRYYLTPPRSSAEMADLVAWALRICNADQISEAADLCGPVVLPLLTRSIGRRKQLGDHTRPTERVERMLSTVAAQHGRWSTTVTRAQQLQLPGTVTIATTEVTMELASSIYHEHLRRLLVPLREDLGVATTAMDLGRMSGLRTWRACAQHLGLDPKPTTASTIYVHKRLRELELSDQWLSQIRRAATTRLAVRPAAEEVSERCRLTGEFKEGRDAMVTGPASSVVSASAPGGVVG